MTSRKPDLHAAIEGKRWRVTIAAAKKIIATISSVIFWPLNMLAANVVRANRKAIRWAIRRRNGSVYLAAIFWFPTLVMIAATWALFSIHEKPNEALPIVTAIAVVAKKVLALIYYVVQQLERIIKAVRHYRRHFL